MTRWRRRADDAGITLVELLVSMTIMSIFMVLFTGAMVMMYRASNQTNAVANSSTQVNNAFARLDSLVRYASAIAAPSTSGSDPTVAWQTVASGSTQCAQLKLSQSAQQLQLRTWTISGAGSPVNVSAWQPLASPVNNVDPASGTSFTPFTVPKASGSSATGSTISQQLRVHLTAVGAAGTPSQATSLDVTFTALNSDSNTDSSTVCPSPGGMP